MRMWTVGAYLTLILAVLAGCAPPASKPSQEPVQPSQAARKQIVAAILSQPAGLEQELTDPTPSGASFPGLTELYTMLDGGLSYLDPDGLRYPWLAEALPQTESGLWRILPDGRMETTWRLRPGIKWHDGAAYTSDDLRFTLDVYRDKDLGIFSVPPLPLIDGVETPDSRTLTLTWRQPYIYADALFTPIRSTQTVARLPSIWVLPRHLLEQPLQQNKATFLGLPYFREGFIGAGPFKMVDWVQGSHAVLAANDDYVLGRPRIDGIEVRFFADRGALKAALLAGAVDAILGRGLALDDVLDIQSSTQDVKVDLGGDLAGVMPMYPQFIDPNPPIVANRNFRQALLMAIDRQEMTDTLNRGLGPVAHSWVQPDQREGRAIEGKIVRYPYDPRAAAQLLDGLGYSRGADGFFRAADGTRLSVGLVGHAQNTVAVPAALSVQTYWQTLGVDSDLVVMPPAITDLKAMATFPSFIVRSLGPIVSPVGYFNRAAIGLPDNNYIGNNLARFGNADVDDLVSRYQMSISFEERAAVLGDMVHLQTDQITMLPLFFQGSAFVAGSARLKNVRGGYIWNTHQWDID